ncbi:hypothetical protein GIB67_023399 [Kingdonia uniflora]|uniref:Uncharacterized protein n=1 Tax=Kingdonia uniflora TaxID=39325 RepID=A0A7J7LIN1_9MAGN|nr:hypothetical protein GIB67_023399 [Kingdonia uniflora]
MKKSDAEDFTAATKSESKKRIQLAKLCDFIDIDEITILEALFCDGVQRCLRPFDVSRRWVSRIIGFYLVGLTFVEVAHCDPAFSSHFACEDVSNYYASVEHKEGEALMKELSSIISTHHSLSYKQVEVRLGCSNGNYMGSDMVQNVSSMARNMFSSQLSDLGLLATFDDDVFVIMKDAIILAWDKRQDAFLGTCNVNDEIIGVVTSMVNSRSWLENLSHVSIWMKVLFSGIILDKLKSIDLFFCKDVVLVKQKKVGFPRKRRKWNMGLNHLYDDVWEPTRVSSNWGFHGFVVFIGDSTRELGVHFLKNETDWFDVFVRWKA